MDIVKANILKHLYRLAGPSKDVCGEYTCEDFKIKVEYVSGQGHQVAFFDATNVCVFRGFYSNIIGDKILSVEELDPDELPRMIRALIPAARAAEKARLELRLAEIEAE